MKRQEATKSVLEKKKKITKTYPLDIQPNINQSLAPKNRVSPMLTDPPMTNYFFLVCIFIILFEQKN